jgi:aerobic-type carbon monoxide dehydrogenase small subunit (CoxS/CutS family)
MSEIDLNLNGRDRRVSAPAGESLLSVLRNRLDLTGTKYGCGEGQCGACTVLVDGHAMRACRTAAGAVAGKKVTTIEGLQQNGSLSLIQQAFLEEGAFQCGYCTSGMIVAATALLSAIPRPTDKQIVQYMDGNICRCGVYPRIAAAIHSASSMQSAAEQRAKQ